MLKRLATAGILTAAVGGVLMSASPAMAGGDDYYKWDSFSKYHLGYEDSREDERVENETAAFANCIQLVLALAQGDQECYIGNVAGD